MFSEGVRSCSEAFNHSQEEASQTFTFGLPVHACYIVVVNIRQLVSSLPILCINIRNNFGNNCLFGKNVTQLFNDTGEFTSIGITYAIQYSCCKGLIHLLKKENSNNTFSEKFALPTPFSGIWITE